MSSSTTFNNFPHYRIALSVVFMGCCYGWGVRGRLVLIYSPKTGQVHAGTVPWSHQSTEEKDCVCRGHSMSWSNYFSCSSSHRSTLPLFPPFPHRLPRHIHFTVSCQEIVALQQRNRHFRDAFIKDEMIWLIDICGNVVDIRSPLLGLIQGDACRCLCNVPDVCGQEHPSSVWWSHKDRVRSTKNLVMHWKKSLDE